MNYCTFQYINILFKNLINRIIFILFRKIFVSDFNKTFVLSVSRGARDSKIGKKWPESSRILDYILS